MKVLLSIIPYGITAHELFVMREPIKTYPSYHFFKVLPEFCIRDDNGRINYTEHFHFFTGQLDDNSPTKYYLFDVNPVDLILQEEISNCGIEELFDGYNWKPLFEHIPINESPLITHRIPFSVHVVVDLEYLGAGEDVELFVDVLGYLDGKMELKRI